MDFPKTSRWILGLVFVFLFLVGCGAPAAAPVTPTETAIPATATTLPPTATPVPPTATAAPPTETPVPPTATLPPSIAKPGATLVGTIAMATASSARITLKVSEDGRTIQSVSLAFTGLKCEGFSADSISTEAGGKFPILEDKFEVESSSIGKINGLFSSPTKAAGSYHVLLNLGFGGAIECGTWPWSATGE
jgi:hypothetical protein